MRVKELIEKLLEHDGDLPVRMRREKRTGRSSKYREVLEIEQRQQATYFFIGVTVGNEP